MPATLNRRVFITGDGHIGLGPASLRKGDELYLIKGGRTPFVLRRSGEKTLPGSVSFELVSDCYTHGMMDSNNQNVDSHSNMRRKWLKINLV
ncbi:hypothetical protein V2W45_1337700 [Cenococcum geophilum]